MNICELKKDLKNALQPYRKSSSIGLIPTMGALHTGHLSLIQQSAAENDCTVVSIFVNPTQFNNQTDLAKYPRTLETDVALLAKEPGPIVVFAPTVAEVYGSSPKSKNYDFGTIIMEMEGKHRPGHFNGVGTVLNLLFEIVQPTRAYFGEKDFQQVQVVKKMVAIEKQPVKIVVCPIVREKNGLAMSSRNQRLTNDQKEKAGLIYKTLEKVKKHFDADSIPELRKRVTEIFENENGMNLEYFEIAPEDTLIPAQEKQKDSKYRAFIAVYVGDVRLIDTMAMEG